EPGVSEAMGTLTSEFGIKDEFFEGEGAQGRTLLLASVAKNLADLETEGKTAANSPRDFEFIADGAFVIAQDYVTGMDELVAHSRLAEGDYISAEGKKQVLDKYTSHELTEELAQRISQDGLLDGVKKRMGITDENEKPYQLRVLSMSASLDYVNGFESTEPFPSDEDYAMDSETAQKQHAVATDSDMAAASWKQGLIERRKSFNQEWGSDFSGVAFKTTLGGETYLCLTADMAERMLDPEAPERGDDYGQDELEREMATLEHEYAHTQEALNTNMLGISAEERRAEHFSGNRNGYLDVKTYFTDVNIVTGFDIRTYFDEAGRAGGTAEDLYAKVSSEFGLKELVYVMGATPRTYAAEQASDALSALNEYVGGYDGAINRLLRLAEEGKVGDGSLAMQRRIQNAAKILEPAAGVFLETRRGYSPTMTGMIEKEFTDQLAA
ncbi:hypothetical protein KC957_03085, partial [Candidatus Saccharibacteria bacterium]|nr:hypothetical protein [Candidatus Saccharibacteria bacterium]